MSSEQDQSSNTSSAAAAEAGPRSLIVSNVLLDADLHGIHDDLNQNYADVENITRMYANDGQALAAIRVDFSSEEAVAEILEENAIYIRNRSHRVRPYWPRVCRRCQNEGHFAAECPQNFSNARYLRELVDEQNTQFQSMINDWEEKWNARLTLIKPRPAVSAKSNSDLQLAVGLVQQFKSLSRRQTELANEVNKKLDAIDSRVKTEIK